MRKLFRKVCYRKQGQDVRGIRRTQSARVLVVCGAGDVTQTVVAEVNNTPWGEQHCYVLWNGNRVNSRHAGHSGAQRFQRRKRAIYWPLCPWTPTIAGGSHHPPGASAYASKVAAGTNPYDAAMQLRRTELNERALAAH